MTDAAGQTSPPVCSPSRPDPARESVAMTREAGTFSPTTAMVPDETSGQAVGCRHETAAVGALSICSGACRRGDCDCHVSRPRRRRQDPFETKVGRIAAIIMMDDTDWSAAYGENCEIAEMVGCTVGMVAAVRMNLRRGWRPKGCFVGIQPGSLKERLLELDKVFPGLTRSEQARALGTTPGMIRDTVYRLRLDGHVVSDSRSGNRKYKP